MVATAKNYCFTLNNYTDDDERRLAGNLEDVQYIIYGREIAETGTRHLQGFVSFKRRKSLQAVKRILGNPTVHCEVARNVNASIEYCKKDGDFIENGHLKSHAGQRSDLDDFKEAVKGGMLSLVELREHHSDVFAKYPRFVLQYVDDHAPEKVIDDHEFREWQADLNGRLNLAPDDRTIEFIVDHVGNSGKTWFAHWYAARHDRVQVIQPGKKADMAFVLDTNIRVLFVDAPRSKQGEFLQYDFLEDVKNGYVFSTKYESRVKKLNKCHVVIMMNEEPDMTKLSADRYKITYT